MGSAKRSAICSSSRSAAKESCFAKQEWRFAWTAVNGFVNIAHMDWVIVYYGGDVQGAILALPPGLQARYIHLTERMLAFGPDLGMPHTRELKVARKRMREVQADDDT